MSKPSSSEPFSHSVLFICAANQCRSVMAEYGLKSLLEKHSENPNSWNIASAGIHAFSGLPASAFAIQALRDIKQDASQHRSRQFSCQLLADFALILCMQKYQQLSIQQSCPSIASRVYLFTCLNKEEMDIEDPYGLSLASYQETLKNLLDYLENGWGKLFSLSSLQ